MRLLHLVLQLCISFQTMTAWAAGWDEIGVQPEFEKKTFAWTNPRIGEPKYDAYALDIRFGQLTREQFEFLKTRYGGQSEVPYSPARAYELVDFLPPLFQATNQTQFIPGQEPITWPKPESIADDGSVEMKDLINWAETDRKAHLATNCWGTTVCSLRAAQEGARELETGWLSRTSIGHALSNANDFIEVTADQARFQDVMLVQAFDKRQGFYVTQHAGIMIEPGLVFEKTDTSESDAIRIAYEKDVREKMKGAFGDQFKITYHRLKPGRRMPSIDTSSSSLETVYSGYLTEQQLKSVIIGFEWNPDTGKPETILSAHKTINAVRDPATGRYVLDPSNPLAQRFKRPDWISKEPCAPSAIKTKLSAL